MPDEEPTRNPGAQRYGKDIVGIDGFDPIYEFGQKPYSPIPQDIEKLPFTPDQLPEWPDDEDR